MDNPSPTHSLPAALQQGVRFRCTDCGACCSGAPGRVRVTEEEIRAISGFRKQDPEVFRGSEVVEREGETCLREKENGDCVLFKDGRCSVHPVKPIQCRLYPFWFRNVRSEDAWAKTCAECPGIGEGEVVSPEEILRQVQADLDDRVSDG